jgi:outer membrane immunogenic protein
MRSFLSALAVALTAVTAANAADMPAKAPYQRPTVVENDWHGFYVGINGGYNLGKFNPVFGTGEDTTKVDLSDNSPFVGGHTGYLFQTGAFVIGVEGGLQYWNWKASDPNIATFQQQIDWVAYANLRAGLTPFNGMLLYVTGGAAWAHSKSSITDVADLGANTLMGWNVGLGTEFKLNNDWLIGAEYRHYDFGKASPAPILVGFTGNLTNDQILGRITRRFN